jgi:hypothetical protein
VQPQSQSQPQPLQGRVVIVAGAIAVAGPIAAALQSAGATVALVSQAATARDDVTVHLRADPSQADVWERIAMHVEQHLGPVDAAVADAAAAPATRHALATDLARRRRGDVVVVEPGDDAADVVRKVLGTQ